MKGWMKLFGFGALLALSGICQAAKPSEKHDALALEILEHLEVNTFRNSFRPRHYPQGTTIGQTPYRIFAKEEGFEATYSAIDEEQSWVYSVTVMKAGPQGVTVCFVDHSLQGTYLTASALLVRKKPNNHYVVIKMLPETPECAITRG